VKLSSPIAGIILSAGASSRMGTPKALLKFHGETFLDRLIRLFSEAGIVPIVVLGIMRNKSARAFSAAQTQRSL
jgi:CTP:molybdopterin cytidylyltransferase MocA